jgi:hypothetical protein
LALRTVLLVDRALAYKNANKTSILVLSEYTGLNQVRNALGKPVVGWQRLITLPEAMLDELPFFADAVSLDVRLHCYTEPNSQLAGSNYFSTNRLTGEFSRRLECRESRPQRTAVASNHHILARRAKPQKALRGLKSTRGDTIVIFTQLAALAAATKRLLSSRLVNVAPQPKTNW